MAVNGPPASGRTRTGEARAFRLNLAIFVAVNAVLLVIGAALLVAGFKFAGDLWPYPVVMGLWGVRVAWLGYRAYHGADR